MFAYFLIAAYANSANMKTEIVFKNMISNFLTYVKEIAIGSVAYN